jgi:transposase-like protein
MLDLSDLDVRYQHIRIAPSLAPCPRCRTWVSRHEVRTRYFWTADLKQPTISTIDFAAFICPACPPGKRFFHLLPPAFQTDDQYDVDTRIQVVQLVIEHALNFERAAAIGRQTFHLPKLHASTVLRWVREHGDQQALRVRHWQKTALDNFSGQIAVDELYDGPYYILRAVDPLNDTELDWFIGEGSPDKEDIRDFLKGLKDLGFQPQLVVTDGSRLYPEVIASLWPAAQHQRCVFHFIMAVNKLLGTAFWAAYKTMPTPPKRKAGRPKKRGRKRQDKQKKDNQRTVRAARYLFLKRRLSEDEQAVLDQAMALCEPLRELRRFVSALHRLFGPRTQGRQATLEARDAVLADAGFAAIDALAPVLKQLGDDGLFEKLVAYQDFENAAKTSNAPERKNREHRRRQKRHYRVRSLETLIALLNGIAMRPGLHRGVVRLVRRAAPPPSAVAPRAPPQQSAPSSTEVSRAA